MNANPAQATYIGTVCSCVLIGEYPSPRTMLGMNKLRPLDYAKVNRLLSSQRQIERTYRHG